jgi:putative flippase GtrA
VTLDCRRWGVFNLVAFTGFLLQIGVIAVLTRRFVWPPLAATFVAFELAALQNFVGHASWTWGDRRPASFASWARRYWRYQAAQTGSLAANLAATTALAAAGLPPEIANVAAVLMCAVPNYLVSEHLVFRRTP